jgi:hypothetical protein
MKRWRVAIGAGSIAVSSLGAVAVGAFAIGALAVGALAVGRLSVDCARFKRLEIDELVVHKLTILDRPAPPDVSPS